MPTHDDLCGITSTHILQQIARELAGPNPPKFEAFAGLPAATVAITSARLIVTVTPLPTSHFEEQALNASSRTGFDTLVVSTGLHPEVLDPVTVSAFTFDLAGTHMIADLTFCRALDGGLLLVPPEGDWAFSLTPTGLRRIRSALADPDERAEAACRWAGEIVRLVRRGR